MDRVTYHIGFLRAGAVAAGRGWARGGQRRSRGADGAGRYRDQSGHLDAERRRLRRAAVARGAVRI